MRLLKEAEMEPEDNPFSAGQLAKLIDLADAGTSNGTGAKEVFAHMFRDEGALREVIRQVLEENPQSVADYVGGKEKALGFLVGQTMRAMKGKADPGMVNQILKEVL